MFEFSCAGHGGLVAVLGAAPHLPSRAVELAERFGKLEYVASYSGDLITSERYTVETFDRLRESGRPVFEC